jgi:hypothetical protein
LDNAAARIGVRKLNNVPGVPGYHHNKRRTESDKAQRSEPGRLSMNVSVDAD